MKYNKFIVLLASATMCLSVSAQKLESIYKALPELDKVQMMNLEKNEACVEKCNAAIDQVQEDMMSVANLSVAASKAIQSAAGKNSSASMPQMSAMSAGMLKELQKMGISLDQLSNMSEEELMELMMPIIQQMNGGVTVDINNDDDVISAADSKIMDKMGEVEEKINDILLETSLKCAHDDCERRYNDKTKNEFEELWLQYEEKIMAIQRELDERLSKDIKDGNAIPTPAYANDYFNRMNDEVKAYNMIVIDKWCSSIDSEIEANKKILDQTVQLYSEWFKLRETLSTKNARQMAGVESGFTSIHIVMQYYIRLIKVKAEVPVHEYYSVPEMIGGMG